MESNNKRLLHIATGDYEPVKYVVKRFNEIYKSNFIYLDSIDREGVLFSVIDINGESDDLIFLLGSTFAFKLCEMKEKGEIDDW